LLSASSSKLSSSKLSKISLSTVTTSFRLSSHLMPLAQSFALAEKHPHIPFSR
jgi:hypothetical protein